MSKVFPELVHRVNQASNPAAECQDDQNKTMAYPEDHPAVLALLLENQRLSAQVNRLEQRLNHDHLTGLYSRAYGVETLERLLNDPRLSSCGLAFLDVDKLKAINDNYGHQMGDKALRFVGHTLSLLAEPHTQLARLSGDEFIAIFPNGNEQKLQQWCQTLNHYLAQHPYAHLNQHALCLTVSYGIFVHHYHSDTNLTALNMLDFADKAMYNNKKLKQLS